MNKIIYPAIVDWDKKDKAYIIEFQDVEAAHTFAESDEEIFDMARDVLELCLYEYVDEKKDFPKATKLKDIRLRRGQHAILVDLRITNRKILRVRSEISKLRARTSNLIDKFKDSLV